MINKNPLIGIPNHLLIKIYNKTKQHEEDNYDAAFPGNPRINDRTGNNKTKRSRDRIQEP